MRRLIVKGAQDLPLFVLNQANGVTIVEECVEEMAPAVNWWVLHGLHEWPYMSPDGKIDRPSRVTPSSDPEFLWRIARYVSRQSNLPIEYRHGPEGGS